MIKNIKYFLVLIFLAGCFEINKPFEHTKINMPLEKSINSGLFISDIIGLSETTEIIFKNKISNKLLNKNILTSYNFFNKNSHILRASIISYKKNNKKIIIFNLYSPLTKQNNKLKLLITNKDLESKDIQEKISNKVSEFVEKVILKKNEFRFIRITKITGLLENKKQENIFIEKLVNIGLQKDIKIIKETDSSDIDYSLEINFSIESINEDKIKLKINWLVFNKKKELIGNIKQENIFLKSLLKTIWPQISSKIIEMAFTELILLLNVQK